MGVGAAAGPGTASAFVGESQVINPSTGNLTTPAEMIITNPTFLEEFEEAAPESQKKGLLRTLMGSRALPMIGRVLPFVGGAFVAYEICNLVMGGCLSFEEDGSSSTAPVGNWKFQLSSFEQSGVYIPAMSYAWTAPSNPIYTFLLGENGVPSGCGVGFAVPSGTAYVAHLVESVNVACGGSIGTIKAGRSIAVRTAAGHRVNYGAGVGSTYTGSDYCRAWGGSSSCQATPGSDWSKQAASHLATEAEPEVGQWIAAKVAPGAVKDPYTTYVDVPDCDGLLWAACEDLLEELGLEAQRSALDWEGAFVDQPADAVIETSPAAGVELAVPSKVTVTTNPDETGMPLVVVQPESGETYSEYITKLAPGLNPERVNVGEAFTDPTAGPNAVLRTTPEPGSRLDPKTEHDVEVQTNPPTAPMPAGGWSPPGLPSLDMAPLMGLGSPCTVFPFGLFCWLGEALAQFNTPAACPNFSAPVAGTESDFAVTLCGETSETIMSYLRPALLLAFIVGLGFLFARGTKAVGGD